MRVGRLGRRRRSGEAATPYTYRFATFDPVADKIGGTLNRFNYPSNSYWWVPGSAEPPSLPGASMWTQGGGIFPINSPYGPGFSLVCDPDMVYQGAGDSRVVRFQIDPNEAAKFPTPIPFLGSTHTWEWTWRRPSAGAPSGWPSGVLLEGMLFGTTLLGTAYVGSHFYLDNNWNQAGPFHYYAARVTGPNTWSRVHCPYPFDADQYHSIKWEIKWSTSSDGFMRAYTDTHDGNGMRQWMNYSGATVPATFEGVYAIMQDIRPPLGGTTVTLEWINHRLTLS